MLRSRYRAMGKAVPAPDSACLKRAWSVLCAAAAKASVTVVLGTERVVDGALLITALVINRDGTIAGFQDKVQLDPSEEATYTPGCGRRLFQSGPLRFGVAICHEGWRYPETVRWAARHGAQVADQHAVADYVHIFSPRVVNDLRVGFTRFVLDYVAEGAVSGGTLGNQLGAPNANTNPLQSNIPIFSPVNFTGIGQSRSLPIYRRENTFQYLDGMTWTRGRHTLKFGADIRRWQNTEYQTNLGNGRFNLSPGFTALPGLGGSGNSMASFALDYV